VKIFKARGAVGSIKSRTSGDAPPGTPHWGGAKRNPRNPVWKIYEAPGRQSNHVLVVATSIGRFAGSIVFSDFDPGVALRFTPGFMPAAAPRTKNLRGKATDFLCKAPRA
jgi:hypothetical protein